MLDTIQAYENDIAEFDVDGMNEDDDMSESLSDEDILLKGDIFGSFPNLFVNGDARRYTTLNFGYQLACYSVSKYMC